MGVSTAIGSCAASPRTARTTSVRPTSAEACATCGFGCPYGAKQSTVRTWLADAQEQGARFDRDRRVRHERGDVEPPRDDRLLHALAAGFPACAGVAMGMDRLMMAMLGTRRIADVLAFDFARA